MTVTAALAAPEAEDVRPLSQVLPELAAVGQGDRVSIGEMLAALDFRARGALMTLLAIPNTLPGIPGTSFVTGLPLALLTFQMALGRPPRLPAFISRRTLPRAGLAAVLNRAAPWLARGERHLRPRLPLLVSAPAERAIGILTVILSLIVMLPVPFGNMLPALAIIAFALALMEKDGAFTIVGLVLSALALGVVTFVMWALVKSALFVVLGAFGLV